MERMPSTSARLARWRTTVQAKIWDSVANIATVHYTVYLVTLLLPSESTLFYPPHSHAIVLRENATHPVRRMIPALARSIVRMVCGDHISMPTSPNISQHPRFHHSLLSLPFSSFRQRFRLSLAFSTFALVNSSLKLSCVKQRLIPSSPMIPWVGAMGTL